MLNMFSTADLNYLHQLNEQVTQECRIPAGQAVVTNNAPLPKSN